MPRKLLIVAAGGVLLLTVLGGGVAWMWPSAPAAKAPRVRAAAAPASAPLPAASAPEHSAAASSPEPAAAAAPASPPAADPRSAEGPPDTAPAATRNEVVATPAVGAEAPLDRLQRRLGEVLGARGAVETGRAGELRVLARSDRWMPVSHGAAPAPRPASVAPWSYSGMSGPQAWGRLKPEYSACAKGQRQSPIDIRDGIALDLDAVHFDYRPGSSAVVDDGHTVQVDVAPGSAIEVGGRRYELRQFHFHRPSEERINGRQFEMDVHLVHQDAEGRLAVVAVLLERGAAQPLLQTVWNHLPLEQHAPVALPGAIDPLQLLPADRRYYTYMGSLTTPPCSEGVLWLVLQKPVTLSARQIDVFSRLYPMNARPMQRAAGRVIKQSN